MIDEHMLIAGDITSEGTVRVEGRVEGSQHRAHTLIIGAGGCLTGSVEAIEVVIGGTLTGDLMVAGRVEVQKLATVHGDIRAAAVMLEEGGTVHGHVTVHPLDAESSRIGNERTLMLTPPSSAAALPS